MGRKPAALKPLNNEQRETLSEFASKYPRIVALIRSTRPSLYDHARRTGIDDEEMESIAWSYLTQETHKYDATKAGFGTFAQYIVASAISHHIEMMSRKRRKPESGCIMIGSELDAYAKTERTGIYFDKFVFGEKNYQKSISQSVIDNEIEKTAVSKLINKLDVRSQDVIKMRFGIDGPQYTMKQIAKVFKISKQRIGQIEKRSVSKMRLSIEN